MAGQGARVCHSRAVELGQLYDVKILVPIAQKMSNRDQEGGSGLECTQPRARIAHDTDVTGLPGGSRPRHPESREDFPRAAELRSSRRIVQNISAEGLRMSHSPCDADL